MYEDPNDDSPDDIPAEPTASADARAQEKVDEFKMHAELAAVYDEAGFAMTGGELPDYLPLFMEFCAVAPDEVARNLIRQAAPIIDSIHARLMGRNAAEARAYAAVLAALLAEVDARPEAEPTREQELSDAEELAALDAAYEDEPVVFGPESDPDKQGARAKVGAMIDRLRKLRANSAIR